MRKRPEGTVKKNIRTVSGKKALKQSKHGPSEQNHLESERWLLGGEETLLIEIITGRVFHKASGYGRVCQTAHVTTLTQGLMG